MDLYEIQELIDQTNVLRDLHNQYKGYIADKRTRSPVDIQNTIHKPKFLICVDALNAAIANNEKPIACFVKERGDAAKTHFSAIKTDIPIYANKKTDLVCLEAVNPTVLFSPKEWQPRPIKKLHALAKMATLFADEDVGRGVLHTLLKNGAILAGGAVVYAVCRHVKRNSVGDIDAFITTPEAFLLLIRLLRPFCVKPMLTSVNPYLYEANIKNKECANTKYKCSAVEIDIGQGILIQLIFKEYATSMIVLNLFDLDYVCCAIDREKITMTPDCIEAHASKTVLRGYFTPCQDRLRKAAAKGFSVPAVFGSARDDIPWIPLENESGQIVIASCERTCDAFAFSMADVAVDVSHRLAIVGGKTFAIADEETAVHPPHKIAKLHITMGEDVRSIHEKCRQFDFYNEVELVRLMTLAERGAFEVLSTGETCEMSDQRE